MKQNSATYTYKIKICILTVFIIGYARYFDAQKITISGTIKDKSETAIRIPDVLIFAKSNPNNNVRTNASGMYSITIELSDADTLVFYHAGYEKHQKIITQKSIKPYKNGMLSYSIELTSRLLDDYTYVFQKVDTVFGNSQHSIQDFVLLDNNELLLLVYEKTLNKGSQLWYTNDKQHIISSYTLPFDAQYLYSDYSKKHFVIGHNSVYLITIRNQEIQLRKIETQQFYGFNYRILDTLNYNYYYSDYNPLYPAAKFICANVLDSTQHIIREVKDAFMMELYRAQYKYVSGRDKLWAYRKEQETGIDKEIWIGAASFTQDILYKPLYAPLFIKNDTIHIFDQYKSFLFRYTKNNEKIDSIFVNYYLNPKGEKWEQPLVQDEVTNEIYALYNKGGYNYIRNLNTQNGLLISTTKLSNRFVTNIKIANGYIYYIYRPYETQQKKFLYKEKLNC